MYAHVDLFVFLKKYVHVMLVYSLYVQYKYMHLLVAMNTNVANVAAHAVMAADLTLDRCLDFWELLEAMAARILA